MRSLLRRRPAAPPEPARRLARVSTAGEQKGSDRDVLEAVTRKTVRLLIELDVDNLPPRELRRRFAEELRSAVMELHGDADEAVLEELWRVIPDPERA